MSAATHPRTSSLGPAARIVATVGLLVLGGALLMALTFAASAFTNGPTALNFGPRTLYRFQINGPHWLIGAVPAAALLPPVLFLLWRPRWSRPGGTPARPRVVRAILITLAGAAGIFLLMALSHNIPIVSGDRRFLLGTCSLLAAAGAVLAWLPAVITLESRAPAATPLKLFCPACSYDMSGLSELKCPECGTRYTVDQILAAQRAIE